MSEEFLIWTILLLNIYIFEHFYFWIVFIFEQFFMFNQFLHINISKIWVFLKLEKFLWIFQIYFFERKNENEE
jgi:hypothetical protein